MLKIIGIFAQSIIFLMAMHSLLLADYHYPADPQVDKEWSCGTITVFDIECSFNNARQDENSQLNTSIPSITMPDQATWNTLTDSEKALYLVNAERVDRGLLPLHGVEPHVTSVAQAYADYLLDNDVWGHNADGTSPGDRLNSDPEIDSCHDFLNVAENLAVFVSTISIPMSVERSVYMWMYDDSVSSWGHRHAILWFPYDDNSGPSGREGFLGIGRAVGGPYQGPFSSSWPNAEMIVMNVFDPCQFWNYLDYSDAGINDFSADGFSDLLWHNTSTGGNLLWEMNGSVVNASISLTGVADTNWDIVGKGDFDGNGSLDILWRNGDTGANLIWFMNGDSLDHSTNTTLVANLEWAVRATEDFDGDGKADILWRRITGNGVILWLMDGATLVQNKQLPGIPAAVWDVHGTGDFDGDGNKDLIFATVTGRVIALNSLGLRIWFYDTEEKLTTPPVVADLDNDGIKEVLVYSNEGKITCLNGINGNLDWKYSMPGKIIWGGTSLVVADIVGNSGLEVVASDTGGNLVCLDAKGNVVWKKKFTDKFNSAPAVTKLSENEKLSILTGSDRSPLICISNKGKEKWRVNTEKCMKYVNSSTAVITAMLPVTGYEKAVEVAKAKGCKIPMMD